MRREGGREKLQGEKIKRDIQMIGGNERGEEEEEDEEEKKNKTKRQKEIRENTN